MPQSITGQTMQFNQIYEVNRIERIEMRNENIDEYVIR